MRNPFKRTAPWLRIDRYGCAYVADWAAFRATPRYRQQMDALRRLSVRMP